MKYATAKLYHDSVKWRLDGCVIASKGGYCGRFWNDQTWVDRNGGTIMYTLMDDSDAINHDRFKIELEADNPFLFNKSEGMSRVTHIYSFSKQFWFVSVPSNVLLEPISLSNMRVKAVDGWRAPWKEDEDHLKLDTELGTVRMHELDKKSYASKLPWRGIVKSNCPMFLAKTIRSYYRDEIEKRSDIYRSELEGLL